MVTWAAPLRFNGRSQDYRLEAPVSLEVGQHWMTEAKQGVGPERGADVPRAGPAVPVLQPDLPQRQRHTVRPQRPSTARQQVGGQLVDAYKHNFQSFYSILLLYSQYRSFIKV